MYMWLPSKSYVSETFQSSSKGTQVGLWEHSKYYYLKHFKPKISLENNETANVLRKLTEKKSDDEHFLSLVTLQEFFEKWQSRKNGAVMARIYGYHLVNPFLH